MKYKIFATLLALVVISMFTVTLNAAIINVNGAVYDGSGEEDQGPWVSGNTYIVQTAPNVPIGTTLTISPGVVVKFQAVATFTVNGKLVAQGTEEERITFTSNKPVPAPGDWYAISFLSTVNSGTILEYCDVKYAGYSTVSGSIYFNSAGDKVEVKNCSVDFGLNDGIVVSGASNPRLRDCAISNCRYGIYWSTSLVGELNGFTITGCDRGLYLNTTVKQRYCTIANNDIGVYVASSAPDLGTLSEPGYNTIKNNSQWNYYNNTTSIKNAMGNDWGLYVRDNIDATIFDNEEGKGEVIFEPYLGPLWSDVNYATANVNGKKLARKAGTDELHLTFQRKGKICYSNSIDAGASWMSAVELADPGYAWGPCIAMNASPQPCIAYPMAKESYTTGLQFARFDGSGWQFAPVIGQTHMVGGFNVSPPSMAIDPLTNNVHLTVETSQGTADGYWWFLKYYKFDASNPSAPAEIVVLDQMFVHDEPYLKSPSIALDPLGNCHIAYTKRVVTVNPGDVYYAEQVSGVWQAPVNLSNSEATSTEASIEAYGDSLHVTWTETASDVEKEVWRRSKYLGIPWEDRWDVSNTPTQLSEVPVTVGGITFWSEYEGTNYETEYYSPTLGTRVNLSNTTTESVHPQGVVSFDASKLYTVWTESYNGFAENAIAEIKFGTVTMPAKLAYYAVGVGAETPSSYTVYRDGDTTYPSGISVDYAADELVYNLPYLNPGSDYTLQIVGYHESSSKWNEQVKIDGLMTKVLKVTAHVPETLLIDIPKGYYAEDKQVSLKIRRLTGDYAAVSNITLYRTEIVADKPGKISKSQSVEKATTSPVYAFKLGNCYPNPVKGQANIQFTLPQAGKTSLKVYNIQGQLVKTLLEDELPAGSHNIIWDAKNNNGKQATNGVYLYKLIVGGNSATNKLILVK